jgi:hypothetical protein
VFWFIGSANIGKLYDISIPALIGFSVVAQLIAIPLFMGSQETFKGLRGFGQSLIRQSDFPDGENRTHAPLSCQQLQSQKCIFNRIMPR